MSLTEQIYAQTLLLTRDLQDGDEELLELLCRSTEVSLKNKLREGITPEDCKADFVAAASLYALAAASEADEMADFDHIQVGDVTMKRGGTAAAACLRNQARLMMAPYLMDRFTFRGV